MEKNWIVPGAKEHPAGVLCIVTYLPVRRWRDIIPFLRMSFRVERQLRKSPGLIRYSLRTNLPRKEFWTLSVWTGRPAMSAFIPQRPHATAIEKFEQWAGAGAAFVEWEAAKPDFPWPLALEKLKQPTFYYQPPA